MTYQLAKELMDAGFPQPLRVNVLSGNIAPADKGEAYLIEEVSTPYEPTLSELVEACGDLFSNLTHLTSTHTWHAQGSRSPAAATNRLIDTYSPPSATPEESVAQLWLALHSDGNP